MPSSFLRIDQNAGVTTVWLDRPTKRNALCSRFRGELADTFTGLAGDRETRVVLLTGGEAVFSAGYDIDEIVSSEFRTFGHRTGDYYRAVFGFLKPLVCAVCGAALGGGFDLALAGDFLIVSESAQFGYPEIGFGVPPLQTMLARRIGPAQALELTMTGERIGAERALALGLVSRVLPVGEVLSAARALADRLARQPAAALRTIKAASRKASALPFDAALDAERELAREALGAAENLDRAREYLEQLHARKKTGSQ